MKYFISKLFVIVKVKAKNSYLNFRDITKDFKQACKASLEKFKSFHEDWKEEVLIVHKGITGYEKIS